MEDVITEICGHYKDIDLARLKRCISDAAREGAGRLGFAPLFPNTCLFTIDQQTGVNQWGRIMTTPEYKEAVATIYGAIEGIEQYLSKDLETLEKGWDSFKEIPEAKEIAKTIVWLQDRCNEYQPLRGTKYDTQTPRPTKPRELPKDLQTPKAIKAFEIAVDRGVMAKDGNRYVWKKSTILLAYFCGRLLGDEVVKSYPKKSWKMIAVLPIKEIEEYFEIQNVGQARNNKNSILPTIPRGGEEIETIINSL